MKSLPQISEAEFEVMKVVWQHAPISTNEITDRLVKTTTWSPKTIQTLIKRLVTKGALTYEKQSRMFVYTPPINENEYAGLRIVGIGNLFICILIYHIQKGELYVIKKPKSKNPENTKLIKRESKNYSKRKIRLRLRC